MTGFFFSLGIISPRQRTLSTKQYSESGLSTLRTLTKNTWSNLGHLTMTFWRRFDHDICEIVANGLPL